MSQHNPTRKKAMLEALEKSLGVVTTACKLIGLDRSTHYDWMNKDPEYKQAVENVDNVTLDFAESSLHKQIKDGNTAATIFLLKTKGKKRGYIEKVENQVTTIDEKGEEVGINYKELPTEVLEAIVKASTDKS